MQVNRGHSTNRETLDRIKKFKTVVDKRQARRLYSSEIFTHNLMQLHLAELCTRQITDHVQVHTANEILNSQTEWPTCKSNSVEGRVKMQKHKTPQNTSRQNAHQISSISNAAESQSMEMEGVFFFLQDPLISNKDRSTR
jgi:hypothetical protein